MRTSVERELKLDLDEGFTAVSAQAWAPDAVDQDVTTRSVDVAPLEFQQKGRRVRFEAAPHSVVAVRFERR